MGLCHFGEHVRSPEIISIFTKGKIYLYNNPKTCNYYKMLIIRKISDSLVQSDKQAIKQVLGAWGQRTFSGTGN